MFFSRLSQLKHEPLKYKRRTSSNFFDNFDISPVISDNFSIIASKQFDDELDWVWEADAVFALPTSGFWRGPGFEGAIVNGKLATVPSELTTISSQASFVPINNTWSRRIFLYCISTYSTYQPVYCKRTFTAFLHISQSIARGHLPHFYIFYISAILQQEDQ